MLFLMLTETWLNNHLDAELHVENYTLFRADRTRVKKKSGRNSGGVAIYLRNDLTATSLLEDSFDGIEVKIIFIKTLNLVICVIYRPPDNTQGGYRSTATEFSPVIDQIKNVLNSLPTPMPDIIVAGDFNVPRVSWPQCLPEPGATQTEKQVTQLIQELVNDFFLHQLITRATHKAGNTLDLILTNNTNLVSDCVVDPTDPVSSHHLITCSTPLCSSIEIPEIETERNIFDAANFRSKRMKWNKLKGALRNVDWDATMMNLSPTEMLKKLVNTCEKFVKSICPAKKKPKKHDAVPRDRKILMRKRTKLKNALRKSNHELTKNRIRGELANIERSLQSSYQEQQSREEEEAVGSIKKNPKFFFSYAKARQKIPHQVGPFTGPDGKLITDPAIMADMLASQYKLAFSSPADPKQLPAVRNIQTHLSDLDFSVEDIKEAIDEVGLNAAAGPDRFPAILLKNCRDELAYPLYLLWRKSLDTGEIPEDLKRSVITPIYKNGGKELPKNYRPVALTSHLIKIFEKVVRKGMVTYIEAHNLLNPNQHGFRTGRSCLSQLVRHYDEILQLLEKGKNVDVIYLDFAKAFDKLDFQITLRKIQTMGIGDRILRWIQAFLTNRHQIVHVRGAKSRLEPVISGVPQGSVLGPLLFLILLGDIDKEIQYSRVSSFADDTRVLAGVINGNDAQNLQRDLNLIYRWSFKNNMLFNSGKFECVRYGRDVALKESSSYQAFGGKDVPAATTVRDLGVLMSADGTFKDHISHITCSASLKCGWVLRTFRTREVSPMITLWRALIQPVLDYCCQLWSPSTVGQVQALEGVQASFLNKINSMSNKNYWQQLQALKLYSVERRRERYIVIYIWKVLEGIVPNFGITPVSSRRHGRTCLVPHIKTSAPVKVQNLRFASLAVNGPRLFNSMPQNVRNMSCCTIDTFKIALDKYLSLVPDEPRLRKLVRFCSESSNSLICMKPLNKML